MPKYQGLIFPLLVLTKIKRRSKSPSLALPKVPAIFFTRMPLDVSKIQLNHQLLDTGSIKQTVAHKLCQGACFHLT